MYQLYKKNELNFALVWIISYVVLSMIADNISGLLGIRKIITAPMLLLFAVFLLGWIRKHDLAEKYGLCSFKGNWQHYLYFIPLFIIMTNNLWNGIAMKVSVMETALHVLSMLCVGFVEEVIFRGFLFKAICQDSIKQAIIISSVTFGFGHIVNLLNGRDILTTLLQICYATVIGFLFTVIFYKGKSLWPCIITHGVLNALSIVGISGSMMFHIVKSVILCVICASYALWIWKKTE